MSFRRSAWREKKQVLISLSTVSYSDPALDCAHRLGTEAISAGSAVGSGWFPSLPKAVVAQEDAQTIPSKYGPKAAATRALISNWTWLAFYRAFPKFPNSDERSRESGGVTPPRMPFFVSAQIPYHLLALLCRVVHGLPPA